MSDMPGEGAAARVREIADEGFRPPPAGGRRRMTMSEREDIQLDRPAGVVAGRPDGLRAEIGRSPRPAAGGVAAVWRRRPGAPPRRPFDARGDAS